MRDDHPVPEQDDRAAADLAAERQETTLAALYHAAMLGLPEPELRVLCSETGIRWRDLQDYTPPILRLNEKEDEATLALPF
jgi:hypothetical protein